MIKNLYIGVITLIAGYLAFFDNNKDFSKDLQYVDNDSVVILDSAIMMEIEKNADSFSKSLVSSDKAVSSKIEKAATTITNLKTEVTSLKTIIKEKDKQINELKTTINDFTSSINSKFRLFAIDSQNRK